MEGEVQMNNELNKIIDECLYQHEGGEKFFDALDFRIRESMVVQSCKQ